MLPVLAKRIGGRYTFIGRLSALIMKWPIIRDPPIINNTETKTFPARKISMGSLASECNIRHGVDMYITKSFIAVRFIFLILPNR